MQRFISVMLISGLVTVASAADLPVEYEHLTAPEFVQAVEHAGATAVIPLGILEKHGPHLPLGTDLINVRQIVMRAVQQEYAVVFPAFYFGQIYEAQHQPGTIAYSPDLVWQILAETCDELGRNGIKNIVLVNGHGGNNNFLPYFCQAQLESQRPYAVILFQPQSDPKVEEKIKSLQKTAFDSHAGEMETSMMVAHRPELAHTDRANQQSGKDLDRLDLPYGYTGIWWYSKFPNHYAGDGSVANKEIGDLLINSRANQLAELLRAVKTDSSLHPLLQQFYNESRHPLETEQ